MRKVCNEAEVAAIDAEMENLQRVLIKKANAKQPFGKLGDEIDLLREKRQQLLLEDANKAAKSRRISELEEFLDAQEGKPVEYDEQLVRKLIERITVFDDHCLVEFKSGMETEIQI